MGKGGKDKGKGKGNRRYPDVHELPHCFKVLCPEELVSSLMGHGGRTKDHIQDETGARLVVSQRGEYFPNTRFRILSVHAESPEGILAALDHILDRLVECGEKERTQASQEPEFIGKEAGEYIFRATVTTRMCGAIIGKNGIKVKEIRSRSRAQVSIDKEDFDNNQLLKVISTPDGIKSAYEMINQMIQDECGKEDFVQWASHTFNVGASAEEPRRDNRRPRDSGHGGAAGGHYDDRDGGRKRQKTDAWQSEDPPEEHAGDAQADGDNGHFDQDHDMLQEIGNIMQSLSPELLKEERTITCDLPKDKVSFLIGKGGEHVKEVSKSTHTKVHFEEATGEGQQRMMVVGSMMNVYRAHALMMRRYHEEEDLPEEEPAEVQELQAKLEELQKQLKEAKGPGKGKAKKH